MIRKSVLFLLLFPSMLKAQEHLSLNDAIGMALKNNFSIRIAANDSAVASNNNTIGNAGMLPAVTANGAISQTENNLNQEYADGRVVDRSGAGTAATGAGAELYWTLFDGLKMFASKSKLAEIEMRGRLVYKAEIENTIQEVIASYYNVVQQKALITATEILIAIDSERVALARVRLTSGSGSRLDLLQAGVDLNEQKSVRMKQLALLEDSRDRLNYLLGRKPGTAFTTGDSIVITYQPVAETLRKTVPSNNVVIQVAKQDERISLLELREFHAQRFPEIGFSGGYNYGRTKNEAGFLLLNKTTGFHYGLLLSWNLFDGFRVNRQVKNARLSYESSSLRTQDIQLQTEVGLEKALRDFKNNVDILRLEEENIQLAKENMEVAFERFRSGLSSSLELKNAQLSFQSAELRLVQAQYTAKLSETELMKLNGELVK